MNVEQVSSEIRKEALDLFEAAPDVMRSYRGLMTAASKEGALSAKNKELIALAIGITSKCEGCLVFHIQNAIKHGVTREEIVETISVAIEMGGGPATVYGGKALAAFDQLKSK